MADGNPTAVLADWVASVPPNWSPASREMAADALSDTLACMLAGSRDEVTLRTFRAVRAWGTGRSGVIGQNTTLSAPWAALINGAAAHALDYDDILDPSMSHPSAALVPAILALAEEEGNISGDRCIDAWIVGFEVIARLGEAFNLSHYSMGWHTTLSLGAPGVAAACARLLKLDTRCTAHAIGLAVSMAGGSKRQFGSMAKPLHAGLAAKSGVVAACLARAGVDAAEDVFDGRWGMLEMMAGDEVAGFAGLGARLGARLGAPPAAESYGAWFKAWPSCGSTHRPVEAALELHRQGGWEAGEIAKVEAFVSPTAMKNLRFVYPQTPAEAKFCLPYCVGTALFDGRLDLASFHPGAIGRSDVRNLTGHFVMSVDPALAGQSLDSELFERGTVELTLTSGRKLRAACDHPSGHPRNPMDRAALQAKYFDCAHAAGLTLRQAEVLWSDARTFSSRPAGRSLIRWHIASGQSGGDAR